MNKMETADVCLILEGTYPYVFGGVSSWTHDLITAQNHLTFHIVALLPPDDTPKMCFELPDNVLSITNIFLQKLHKGDKIWSKKHRQKIIGELIKPMNEMLEGANLNTIKNIITAFKSTDKTLGCNLLLNSEESWEMIHNMYNRTLKESSFLDFFWSWRNLFGGFFSVMLADIPPAKCYHALCTGYAGLMLTKAGVTTGKPCMVTEHGIYTNERRIEIASADWLNDQHAFSLSIKKKKGSRELRDFWSDIFTNYSNLCYEISDKIITLYEGNRQLQLEEGAPPEKSEVVANGIDFERFSKIVRDTNHPPTVALIGRVVPIKDVKTFIKACGLLRDTIPELKAYIMGPQDEDEIYYEECLTIVRQEKLESVIEFTGKVKIDIYLPKIDIIALTSISEAQPLVILEAGAAGIPTVATDVGACREMIEGLDNNGENFRGGTIVPLANPQATAAAMAEMFIDEDFYNKCSKNIKKRVKELYNIVDKQQRYTEIYQELISIGTSNKGS